MSSLLRTCSGLDLIIKNNHVKDIFNITYYIGNGNVSSVNNYLNMTSGHYLVKIKDRDSVFDHVVYDTKRNTTKELYTNKPASETVNANGLTSFNSKGFVLGNSRTVNNFNDNYVVTTIKQVEKFFDIVEYTGNGVPDRAVNHALNCEIGMISIKALDIYSNWIVRHKDATGELFGEQPYAQLNEFTQITAINNLTFKVSNNANLAGVRYVAYIYANDNSSSGKIQCGSYIGGYQELSNTVAGIGIVLIPDDVDTITITCKGGTGGSNVWYDPGKPFVPGTPEQKYIAPTYAWIYVDDYSITTQPITSLELWNGYSHTKPLQPDTLPTEISDQNDPTTSVYVEWWTGTMDNPVFNKGHYSSYLVDIGQEFIAAVPQQDYKAPSSGGDVYAGNFSKVIVNDYTYVFEGGSGGPATPEVKVITLEPGINRTIKYNIASGGNLIYSYKTGGQTDVTLKYTLPSISFNSTFYGNGSITIPKNVKEFKIECSGGKGTNDTYLVKESLATAGVLITPGQPYIAPTPASPGQPYIAPTVINVPETTIPAGWRYTDWTSLGAAYFANIGVTSENIVNDESDYKYFNQGLSNSYKMYSYQPPGDECYYNGVVVGGSAPIILAYVPTATQRVWPRRWLDTSGTANFINVNHTWHAEETIPATTIVNPGQPYIAPTPASEGQPYIAPVYSVEPKPYVAPVYLNPGQPYIAPTPYDPGQPYIAAVTGQPYIAASGAVPEKGNVNYPLGLEPYVAAVPAQPAQPETTVPAGWRYSEWTTLGAAYFAGIGVTSKYITADGNDYKRFNQGTPSSYKIYSHQAPGAPCYFDGVGVGGTAPINGYVPTATQRVWPRRWLDTSGTANFINVNHTWHAEETIPATPATPEIAGKGNVNFPAGLPPYEAAKPATAGQPYIAEVTGQPFIAPTPSNPGQPYVPPVIGVGDILGQPSYVSINNQTFTFPGSMGFDLPMMVTDIVKKNDENSQSLVYNIASTGQLKISYNIPNFDTTTKPDFTPYYLLIKKASGNGDWIELDARKQLFNLKTNKADIEVNSEIITMKNDGFIPKSILINELNEKYIYVVIRK